MKPAAAPQELPETLPAHTLALVYCFRLMANKRDWLAKQKTIDVARIAGALGVALSVDRDETMDRILFAEWQRTAQ